MMSNDRNDGIREIDRTKNVGADAGVKFHSLEFRRGQWPRFIENVFWNRELAHVMKKRRCLDGLNIMGCCDAKVSRQTNRILLHTANVAMGYLIFGVDRHRQGLYGRYVKRVQF